MIQQHLHTDKRQAYAWCYSTPSCVGAGEGEDIILLGEHSLVVLDTQGQLRLQKRFDYQPVAFTTYPVRMYSFAPCPA